ncbi:MAG TPA: lipopolysaccharide heptosyltransferase II [Thermoanaerobaculia bacterium]|nr:lipopolysaccharide heptosyltransferase II [Thermoanaerobaculia bacterium]
MVDTVVIGLNWVGDNILALPTYRALHHRFRHEGGIALAAPENVASLLASAGIFREVVAWNGTTRHRVDALRRRRFRRAVILPNSFRSAMIAFAAGIGERWGYQTDFRRFLLTHPIPASRAKGHQLDDYAALLAAMNAPRVVGELPAIAIPARVREAARLSLRQLGIGLDRPLFGIHPGGLYGRAKHWGDARYGALAQRLREDGHDVVLLTSPGEKAQAEAIAAAHDRLPVAGESGDVLELAALISHCSAIVTNDSGPLHLAAALAVPSVSIFGPTDPDRTVIAGVTRVIRRSFGCQPCYARECPLGDHRCMGEISVDEVYEAVVRLHSETHRRTEEIEAYNRFDAGSSRGETPLQNRRSLPHR